MKPPHSYNPLPRKHYYIEEKGWFSSSLHAVSKNAFREHQRRNRIPTDIPTSISRVTQALAVGILAGTHAVQYSISGWTSAGQLALPTLSLYVWSQIPIVGAQGQTTQIPARGPLGAEFQVNSFTASIQADPSVAIFEDGSFVLTWTGNGQDGDYYGIFGQRFDPQGKKIGSEFQINTYTTGYQKDSYVLALMGGGFVVAWTSQAQGGSTNAVFGQRFDASGQKIGGEFRINTYPSGTQQRPCVENLSQGNFIVISVGISGAYGAIFGQIFDAAGQKVGIEFIINTHMTSNKLQPSVSRFSDGGIIVVWASNDGQDGSRAGIYGQRFNNLGVKVGGEFLINTNTTLDQDIPDVKVLSTGDIVVAWESYMQDGDAYGVYCQLLDKNGQKKGGEILISTYTKSYQQRPRIGTFPNGDFVIVWESTGQDSTGTTGIFAQRFDQSGNKIGGEFPVNVYVTSYQERPFIAVFPTGSFVVAWNSYDQDGDASGVFARIFSDSRTTAAVPTTSKSTAMISTTPLQPTALSTTVTGLSNSLITTTTFTVPNSMDGTSYQSTSVLTDGQMNNSSVTTTPKFVQSNTLTVLSSNNSHQMSSDSEIIKSANPTSLLSSDISSFRSTDTMNQIPTLQSTLNVPLIAGLAGAVLLYSMMAGVIYHLRQKSKHKPNDLERGTQLTHVPVSDGSVSQLNRPDSAIQDPVVNRSHRYGHLPQSFDQMPSGEYYSARTIPDLSHYSDPMERVKELARNPPQPIYGDSNDLAKLNTAMLNQPYVLLPEGFGQAPIGHYNSLGTNPNTSHYSDPTERVRELARNPPQAPYGDSKELERLNNAVK